MTQDWLIFYLLTAGVPALLLLGYAVFNRAPKNGPTQNRGVKPSQNSSIAGGGLDGGRGGHNHYITVPRDPQKYTKAMSPKK